MRILFVLSLLLNSIAVCAGNIEMPKMTTLYNSSETGYFKINCNPLSSDKMSCVVEQLFFIQGSVNNPCSIMWNSQIENFAYNSSNKVWTSTNERNNKCGTISFSSLRKTKNGYWSYRFGSHIRFPNQKIDKHGMTCNVFENNNDIEYTSEYKPMNLKCNGFTLSH